jgi:2-oxoglutarate ferredoxin oxidoreductase subunit alpha
VIEGLDRLREQGMQLDFCRIRGFPFGQAVRNFVNEHERCIVIEQNRDGQLRSLLIIETNVAGERIESLRAYGGLPLGTDQVIEGILGLLKGVPA